MKKGMQIDRKQIRSMFIFAAAALVCVNMLYYFIQASNEKPKTLSNKLYPGGRQKP
ncbi:MAG: hypothetical protein KIT34_05195 [Cyanobacteria bacterium TGS_CYA1]|nr:hypothetical protein [Cyanobacteria bacterium TGS_CYA1]